LELDLAVIANFLAATAIAENIIDVKIED